MNCCGVVGGKEPVQSAALASCSACGKKAKKVEKLTLEHILKDEHISEIADRQYYFCETPMCDVVYFSNDTGQYFTKKDVRVRVGIKETQDPIPICYCFNHTAASVREEIARTGRSTVVAFIKAQTKAGNCACEIKNPSGRCCLGEVNKVITALLNGRASLGLDQYDSEPDLAVSPLKPSHDCCSSTSRKMNEPVWNGRFHIMMKGIQRMKRILSFLGSVIVTLAMFSLLGFAATSEKTLRVNGMTCGGCSRAVEQALKKVDGVAEVQAKWGDEGTVRVKYDDKKISLAKIKRVITDAGFEVVDK